MSHEQWSMNYGLGLRRHITSSTCGVRLRRVCETEKERTNERGRETKRARLREKPRDRVTYVFVLSVGVCVRVCVRVRESVCLSVLLGKAIP